MFCISLIFIFDRSKNKIQTERLFKQNNLSTLSWSPPPKRTHLDTPTPGKWHIPIPLITLYWWPWLLIYTINLENAQIPKWIEIDTGVSVISLNFPYSVDINDNHKFIYIRHGFDILLLIWIIQSYFPKGINRIIIQNIWKYR